MNKKLVTTKDIVDFLQIPKSSFRYYCSIFPDYIKVVSQQDKTQMYDSIVIEMAKVIRSSRQEGLCKEEIKEKLNLLVKERGIPMEQQITPTIISNETIEARPEQIPIFEETAEITDENKDNYEEHIKWLKSLHSKYLEQKQIIDELKKENAHLKEVNKDMISRFKGTIEQIEISQKEIY